MDRAEHPRHGLLHHPILDRGDAQRPHLAVSLRDVHPSNDGRLVAPALQSRVQVLQVLVEIRGVVFVPLTIHTWRFPPQRTKRQAQQLLVHVLDDVGESGLLSCSRDESGEFGGHGLVCLGCSRVALAEQAVLRGPFPPRALPRLLGTTGHSATHRGIAVARPDRFVSATHHAVRPQWASPVPPSIRLPACSALRPRQILQRSRHSPRLLLPSRTGTRSASAPSLLRGCPASLALGPVGRSLYAPPWSIPCTAQDTIPAGWLRLGGAGITPSGRMR